MIQRGKGRVRGKDGADPEDAKCAGADDHGGRGQQRMAGAAQSPGRDFV